MASSLAKVTQSGACCHDAPLTRTRRHPASDSRPPFCPTKRPCRSSPTSKTGFRSLLGDLLGLTALVASNDFDARQIRPLPYPVIARKCDTLIWERVYRAISMERQHDLDPSGDVILTLRNPGAPFAVWTEVQSQHELKKKKGKKEGKKKGKKKGTQSTSSTIHAPS